MGLTDLNRLDLLKIAKKNIDKAIQCIEIATEDTKLEIACKNYLTSHLKKWNKKEPYGCIGVEDLIDIFEKEAKID